MFSLQVIRYDRGGQPLWISGKNVLADDKIPNCELCSSKRIFEFQVKITVSFMIIFADRPFTSSSQIMPQLLNSLKCPALDWGIINVYTCENSCNLSDVYAKEFVFKQDV